MGLGRALALLGVAAASGCCSYGPGDGGYPTAPHGAPVQVVSQGGPVLSSPALVTLTYANDPLRATDEAFDDWAVSSDWLSAAGKEYGVGPGTDAKVELTQNAPSSITDVLIDGQLTSWIKDGTLPAPTAQTLYVLYLPSTTTVTDEVADVISCAVAGAYHSESVTSQPPFAYAVVPTCPGVGLGEVSSEVQAAASHEILEAATDPLPASQPAYQLPASSPWNLATASAGGEVADLCFPLSEVDHGFTVSLGWSNAAAAAGGDPCVPSSQSAPYFSVSPEPASLTLVPGSPPAEVALVGWATGPIATPWAVGLELAPGATFQPNATLSETTLENDGTAELKLSVPAGTSPGSATLVVYSQAPGALGPGESPSFGNHESYWPLEVTVP
ncbi:MAG: hypothetical protein ACYDCL_15730 [Myxococcales bacterium]